MMVESMALLYTTDSESVLSTLSVEDLLQESLNNVQDAKPAETASTMAGLFHRIKCFVASPVPWLPLLLNHEAWNCNAIFKLEVVGKTYSTNMVIAAHAIA